MQIGAKGDKSPLGGDIPEEDDQTAPLPIPGRSTTQGLTDASTLAGDSDGLTNYGSIVTSPSQTRPLMGPPALELPDPALPPEEESFARHNRAWRHSRFVPNPHTTPPSKQLQPNRLDAHTVGATNSPSNSRSFFRQRRANSVTGAPPQLQSRFMKPIFSSRADSPQVDVPLEVYRELDSRQTEFFEFLDKELDKIESFYRMKETQASIRLQALRTQLHEMRDRRVQEIREDQLAKEEAARHQRLLSADHHSQSEYGTLDTSKSRLNAAIRWLKPIESAIGIGPARIGRTSKSLQQNASPLALGPHPSGLERPEAWRDFTRRHPRPDDVPYRSAKRKLKLALQEFYRGLELLKSYTLTNRTAFRKINKKYDKAVKARPTQRYMSEKVNKAWFVQSEVLEGQIVAVEDLYARYFERGNHKLAVGKLRSKSSQVGDYSGSVFRNGLMLASGVVFGVQGVVYGAEHLYSPDPTVRVRTSYLLQVWLSNFSAKLC